MGPSRSARTVARRESARKKRHHGGISGGAGRSPHRTEPVPADRRMPAIDTRRSEQTLSVRETVSSPPAVRRTPPPVTERRHEDRAMTLRSEHHILHELPSGPVPGRADLPSSAGLAGPVPRSGNDAQLVGPAPALVPSGATPAKCLHAPPPIAGAGAPPGGASTTIDRSFFTETAMGRDDGRPNDDSKSGGAPSVG